MFCLSCGKKITDKGKFCKYCGVSQTELELDKQEKENFHNSKIPFYRNKTQRAWFCLWVTTLFVFVVSLFIFSKFDEYSINLFNGDFLMVLFLSNIFIGIISFLALFITSIKKNNRVSFFTKKIFIICLLYLLLSPTIFAIEGYKAKSDEEYKNKYYVEITPTPIPTAETNVTPTVIPKKTVKPIQKTIDTDPMINCTMSANCGGDIRKVKKSECDNGTCCQIGSSWIFYTSRQKCIDDQNSAKPKTINNPQIVPTTAVYSPNANKSPVFLSYSGNTIYCPSQNVDAVKSINSTMESKKNEWASKYSECTSNFYTTNSCCVSCKQIFNSDWALCSPSNDCLSQLLEEYKDCLGKCPSPFDYCEYINNEQKSLSSQISNLCK